MHSVPPHLPRDSSSATHKGAGIGSDARGQHIHQETAGVRQYVIPRERGFSLSLAISVVLFGMAILAGGLIPTEEKLPPMIEVDLGIDGVENEPPPLGEVDAGMGEQTPEPPAEPEAETMPETEEKPPEPEPIPEPEPEPIPEPEPEPEPVMEQEPAPEPEPEFNVPKEAEPPPAPKPKPVAKAPPKPRKPVRTEKPAASRPVGSGLTTGRAGVRGSPVGKVGGRGGGRGDFISTPYPQYDATARQRRYEGRGVFLIRYENGRIISVSTVQSTGVPYLDARSIAHISSRWRVKKGASGAATLPIDWRLR